MATATAFFCSYGKGTASSNDPWICWYPHVKPLRDHCTLFLLFFLMPQCLLLTTTVGTVFLGYAVLWREIKFVTILALYQLYSFFYDVNNQCCSYFLLFFYELYLSLLLWRGDCCVVQSIAHSMKQASGSCCNCLVIWTALRGRFVLWTLRWKRLG